MIANPILEHLYSLRERRRVFRPWGKLLRSAERALGGKVDPDALEEALAQMVIAGDATASRAGWWIEAKGRTRAVHEPDAGLAAGW